MTRPNAEVIISIELIRQWLFDAAAAGGNTNVTTLDVVAARVDGPMNTLVLEVDAPHLPAIDDDAAPRHQLQPIIKSVAGVGGQRIAAWQNLGVYLSGDRAALVGHTPGNAAEPGAAEPPQEPPAP